MGDRGRRATLAAFVLAALSLSSACSGTAIETSGAKAAESKVSPTTLLLTVTAELIPTAQNTLVSTKAHVPEPRATSTLKDETNYSTFTQEQLEDIARSAQRLWTFGHSREVGLELPFSVSIDAKFDERGNKYVMVDGVYLGHSQDEKSLTPGLRQLGEENITYEVDITTLYVLLQVPGTKKYYVQEITAQNEFNVENVPAAQNQLGLSHSGESLSLKETLSTLERGTQYRFELLVQSASRFEEAASGLIERKDASNFVQLKERLSLINSTKQNSIALAESYQAGSTNSPLDVGAVGPIVNIHFNTP